MVAQFENQWFRERQVESFTIRYVLPVVLRSKSKKYYKELDYHEIDLRQKATYLMDVKSAK